MPRKRKRSRQHAEIGIHDLIKYKPATIVRDDRRLQPSTRTPNLSGDPVPHLRLRKRSKQRKPKIARSDYTQRAMRKRHTVSDEHIMHQGRKTRRQVRPHRGETWQHHFQGDKQFQPKDHPMNTHYKFSDRQVSIHSKSLATPGQKIFLIGAGAGVTYGAYKAYKYYGRRKAGLPGRHSSKVVR